MKGEIDQNFYCLATRNSPKLSCGLFEKCRAGKEDCFFRHRKRPTLEQYREEYGEDYPDSGAVYFIDKENPLVERSWSTDALCFLKAIKLSGMKDFHIVCACTPWGNPPDDWRP